MGSDRISSWSILVISRIDFEGWSWVLIASVPDLCLRFTFCILFTYMHFQNNTICVCFRNWITKLRNSQTLKCSYMELSVPTLANLFFNLLYVSLGCNHSNLKVTSGNKIFSADCMQG